MRAQPSMFLPTVQNLRGLAALMVVLYHMAFWENYILEEINVTTPRLLEGLFSNGFAGVDLFFVISGFVMVVISARQSPSPKASAKFLLSRFLRIYPLWWIYLGLYIAGIYFVRSDGLIFQPPSENSAEAGGQIAYVLKSFLLIPQTDLPIYGLGWTLVHEMMFYAIFAVFLLFGGARLIWLVLVWVFCIFLFSAGTKAPIANGLGTLAFHYMNFEFIFGVLAGLAFIKWGGARGAVIFVLGLAGLMTSLTLFEENNAVVTLAYGRVLPFGLPAAALVYGAAALDLRALQGLSRRLILSYFVGCLVCLVLLHQLPHPGFALGAGLVVWALVFFGMSQWEFRVTEDISDAFHRFFFSLGNASYTFYLSHWIVLFMVSSVWLKGVGLLMSANILSLGNFDITTIMSQSLIHVTLILSAFVASIVFAMLAYTFIEKPIVRLSKRALARLF